MAQKSLGHIHGWAEQRRHKAGGGTAVNPVMVRGGSWTFNEEDLLLIALLKDPIFSAELCWGDPGNHEYSGCYRVRDYQYPLFRTTENFVAFACARAVGKALADYARVLTPTGYVRIDELKVGNYAIGSDGKPTRILGVYPQEGSRDLYRVTFKDGATVDCDADHLWTVSCDSWNSRGHLPKTLTTKELSEQRARFKVQLPTGPVEFVATHPPRIDPWAAGALTGDGNFTPQSMVRFSTADPENLERLEAGLPGSEVIYEGRCDYRLRSVGPSPGPCEALRWTREVGLAGHSSLEKFIPPEFMWGSVAARKGYLRGLSDADGTVTHGGSVEIGTSSPRLAKDLRHLVLSLGGRCSVMKRKTTHADGYRVFFRIEGFNPFLLKYKRDAYDANSAKRIKDRNIRAINSIERIGTGTTTCIEIENQDGLFMTEDMVLTHNTESMKARAFSHAFRRIGENLLITAPELVHLLPLTDAIEERIHGTKLTREFLDVRGGKTGFTHRPFGVDFIDGTKIIGRIPRLTGTGVKGMHQPDLLIEEAQNYPKKGWIEVQPTVEKDHVDREGNPDFSFLFYGVHSGERDSGFSKRISEGGFRLVSITAIQRPRWGKAEKEAEKAAFGGTSNPDYRRNVLGEPGSPASAFFVTARLFACIDQGPPNGRPEDSKYNSLEYVKQELRFEEVEDMLLPIGQVLDLPGSYGNIYMGADLGLNDSPTVISCFSHEKVNGTPRLKLIRLYILQRFTSRRIRETFYALGAHFGAKLIANGIDATGLGNPIWQEMQEDEVAPKHLIDVTRGYFFNAKVPVGVEAGSVVEDSNGNMRDQYGSHVKKEVDEFGQERYVVTMPMIEAGRRYLRELVDGGELLLPFDSEITTDLQGETQQRVKAVGERTKLSKPNAFHILDSFTAMAMGFKAGEVEEALVVNRPVPVLDMAL